MTEIIFIEGVSGVGKSTMVQILSRELTDLGYKVEAYLEGDCTNPIDFYNTAYFTICEYEKLCNKYCSFRDFISANTIMTENARLIRYGNEKKFIFDEPLLSELSENELCYHPKKVIPINKYISVYTEIWKNYQGVVNGTVDFAIFDGSLLHHPLNDMINNYHINEEQAARYISELLNALKLSKKYIFYLKTDNISERLRAARRERDQTEPTRKQIEYWKRRYKYEMIVLSAIDERYQILDVSDNGWNLAKEEILYAINPKHKNGFTEY